MTSIQQILIFVCVLIVLYAIKAAYVVVPQAKEYVVETLGKYSNTLKPGFHLLIPGIQRIMAQVSLKETILEIEKQQIISKDNATVDVDAIAFYQVQDSYKTVYVIQDFEYALSNLVQTNLRTVMGSLQLDEILSQRALINSRLLDIIDEITKPWGIKVLRVEVKEIHPNKNILIALSKQITAEREKRALIIEAEGIRESKYQQAIAIERLAEAEANSIKIIQDTISKTDKNAANYMIAQKYLIALEKISSSSNTKVIMLPMESSSILGALSGISELFNNKKDSTDASLDKSHKAETNTIHESQ